MTGSKVHFVALACSVVLALAACKSGDDDDSGNSGTGGMGAVGTGGMGTVGTGGTTAGGTGGTTAGGTGGMAAGGTGGMAAGGAGMGAPPGNMPNAMCLAGTTMTMPMCDACACTPNAMNGCLEELTACATDADMAAATACKALIDCASKNSCNGNACVTPCMAEVTAASMMGNALTNAMAVGACTSTKCKAVCPQ